MRPDALERYEIRRELGRGGMGVVYEAYDAESRAVVALKTIESAFAENLYRLKHEFRALSDIHHPNLVRFGELAYENGQWFFTMELVRGTDFVDYVRVSEKVKVGASSPRSGIVSGHVPVSWNSRDDTLASPDGTEAPAPHIAPAVEPTVDLDPRFHEGRLRDALAQLVSGLSALHDAGQVHRDIKPSNVLVSDEGRVVVLDFGLAAAIAQGSAEKDARARTVGTPAFMSPEQIEGTNVGPEADWYAVGVMLFLALTGRLPFQGTTTAILDGKRTRDALAPRDLVPLVPEDLDVLCTALLARDPAHRPTGAQLRLLLGVRGDAKSSLHIVGAGRAPPFVGRDTELDRLTRAFDDVETLRKGRRVVIEGEAGIGKSALVQAFLRGRARDAVVLSGRCYEQEDVPFKGVDAIVDALSDRLMSLPDAEVQRLVGGGVRYLAAVFPVLNRVPAIADVQSRTRAVSSPVAVRQQAFDELERLIDELARDHTLVVFLDDLQWADRDSLAFLESVLSGARRVPCLFVGTLRTGDVPAEIAAFVADAERISLTGLSGDDARALARELLPQAGDGQAATSEAIVRDAGGHPLFLAELVHAQRNGQGRREGAELKDVLWDRIQGHDAIDRAFLEMVAVAGMPMTYEVLAKAAGIDPGEAQTRLGGLRAAQLIRVGRRNGGRFVEPYHDRLRESILAHLGSAKDALAGTSGTTQMHARLGRTLLESTPPEELPANVFAIVQHLNAARDLLDPGEVLRLAELNLVASQQCMRATAHGRARDHARIGLGLLGASPWETSYELARDLTLQCISAHFFFGEIDAARACFEDAREHVHSASDRTDVYVVWISLLTIHREIANAIAIGRERLAELGIHMPARVTARAVLASHFRLRALRGDGLIADLVDLPEITDPTYEAAIKVLVAMVPAGFFLDRPTRAWMHMRIVEYSLEHGLSDQSAYGFAGYGIVLIGQFDKIEEGTAFGRLALAIDAHFRNERFGARLQFLYAGWHVPWVRPFVEAKAMLRQAYELAKQSGDTVYETYSATVFSVVSFCESSTLASVREAGAWAREIGERRQDYDMAGVPDAHARYAAALESEPVIEASREPRHSRVPASIDAEFRAALGNNSPTSTFYYHFCNAEIAYLFGDAARADALLDGARSRAQVIFGLPTTIELCFLESLVAARLGREADIAVRLPRLQRWAKACPVSYAAHAWIVQAELERVRGNADAATELFARAVGTARANKSAKREAIALELSAIHARALGETSRADHAAREAAAAYARWGSRTKAADVIRSV